LRLKSIGTPLVLVTLHMRILLPLRWIRVIDLRLWRWWRVVFFIPPSALPAQDNSEYASAAQDEETGEDDADDGSS
jgi:hypothetical protein